MTRTKAVDSHRRLRRRSQSPDDDDHNNKIDDKLSLTPQNEAEEAKLKKKKAEKKQTSNECREQEEWSPCRNYDEHNHHTNTNNAGRICEIDRSHSFPHSPTACSHTTPNITTSENIKADMPHTLFCTPVTHDTTTNHHHHLEQDYYYREGCHQDIGGSGDGFGGVSLCQEAIRHHGCSRLHTIVILAPKTVLPHWRAECEKWCCPPPESESPVCKRRANPAKKKYGGDTSGDEYDEDGDDNDDTVDDSPSSSSCSSSSSLLRFGKVIVFCGPDVREVEKSSTASPGNTFRGRPSSRHNRRRRRTSTSDSFDPSSSDSAVLSASESSSSGSPCLSPSGSSSSSAMRHQLYKPTTVTKAKTIIQSTSVRALLSETHERDVYRHCGSGGASSRLTAVITTGTATTRTKKQITGKRGREQGRRIEEMVVVGGDGGAFNHSSSCSPEQQAKAFLLQKLMRTVTKAIRRQDARQRAGRCSHPTVFFRGGAGKKKPRVARRVGDEGGEVEDETAGRSNEGQHSCVNTHASIKREGEQSPRAAAHDQHRHRSASIIYILNPEALTPTVAALIRRGAGGEELLETVTTETYPPHQNDEFSSQQSVQALRDEPPVLIIIDEGHRLGKTRRDDDVNSPTRSDMQPSTSSGSNVLMRKLDEYFGIQHFPQYHHHHYTHGNEQANYREHEEQLTSLSAEGLQTPKKINKHSKYYSPSPSKKKMRSQTAVEHSMASPTACLPNVSPRKRFYYQSRVVLTGTPLQNEWSELFNLVEWANRRPGRGVGGSINEVQQHQPADHGISNGTLYNALTPSSSRQSQQQHTASSLTASASAISREDFIRLSQIIDAYIMCRGSAGEDADTDADSAAKHPLYKHAVAAQAIILRWVANAVYSPSLQQWLQQRNAAEQGRPKPLEAGRERVGETTRRDQHGVPSSDNELCDDQAARCDHDGDVCNDRKFGTTAVRGDKAFADGCTVVYRQQLPSLTDRILVCRQGALQHYWATLFAVGSPSAQSVPENDSSKEIEDVHDSHRNGHKDEGDYWRGCGGSGISSSSGSPVRSADALLVSELPVPLPAPPPLPAAPLGFLHSQHAGLHLLAHPIPFPVYILQLLGASENPTVSGRGAQDTVLLSSSSSLSSAAALNLADSQRILIRSCRDYLDSVNYQHDDHRPSAVPAALYYGATSTPIKSGLSRGGGSGRGMNWEAHLPDGSKLYTCLIICRLALRSASRSANVGENPPRQQRRGGKHYHDHNSHHHRSQQDRTQQRVLIFVRYNIVQQMLKSMLLSCLYHEHHLENSGDFDDDEDGRLSGVSEASDESARAPIASPSSRVNGECCAVEIMDGRTTLKERQEMIRRFNMADDDEDSPPLSESSSPLLKREKERRIEILIVSTHTAAYGIELSGGGSGLEARTASNHAPPSSHIHTHVILFDAWWNPQVDAQAVGRVFRPYPHPFYSYAPPLRGKRTCFPPGPSHHPHAVSDRLVSARDPNHVTIYRLITGASLEEWRVLVTQQRKLSLFQCAMGLYHIGGRDSENAEDTTKNATEKGGSHRTVQRKNKKTAAGMKLDAHDTHAEEKRCLHSQHPVLDFFTEGLNGNNDDDDAECMEMEPCSSVPMLSTCAEKAMLQANVESTHGAISILSRSSSKLVTSVRKYQDLLLQ